MLRLPVLFVLLLHSSTLAFGAPAGGPCREPVTGGEIYWSMDDGTIRAATLEGEFCGIVWQNIGADGSIAIDRNADVLYYSYVTGVTGAIRVKDLTAADGDGMDVATGVSMSPSLLLSDLDLNDPFLHWHDNKSSTCKGAGSLNEEDSVLCGRLDIPNVGESQATMRLARVVGGTYWWSVDNGGASSVWNGKDSVPHFRVKIFDEPTLVTALGMGPEFAGGPGSAALYWAIEDSQSAGKIYAAQIGIGACIFEPDGMGGFKRVDPIISGHHVTAIWGYRDYLYWYDDQLEAIGRAKLIPPHDQECYSVEDGTYEPMLIPISEGDANNHVRGIAFAIF